jgi:hypothetical protein
MGNGCGIQQIGFVEFFYVGGITPKEVRRPSIGLHHDAHLSSGIPKKTVVLTICDTA